MRERLQKVERMERVMSVEQTNKTGTEMGGTINGWLRGVGIAMMDYRDHFKVLGCIREGRGKERRRVRCAG